MTELDLNHNRISFFPEGVLELETLHTLDLSSNLLSEIPLDHNKWSKLKKLNQLSLACNRIKELPKNWISEKCLWNLQKLNCGFNQLSSFDIFEMNEMVTTTHCALSQLILSGNRIEEFPKNFIDAVKTKLRVLYLGHNNISQTIDFTSCTSLVLLNLCYNSIHEPFEHVLPKLFSTPSLQYLDLEGNYLEWNDEEEVKLQTTNSTTPIHNSLNDSLNRKISQFRSQLFKNNNNHTKENNNNHHITNSSFKELKILPQFNIKNTIQQKDALISQQLSYCNGTFRPDMEDAHLMAEGEKVKISDHLECLLSIYGIFDGHAGHNVSDWMAQNFVSICKDTLKNELFDLNP